VAQLGVSLQFEDTGTEGSVINKNTWQPQVLGKSQSYCHHRGGTREGNLAIYFFLRTHSSAQNYSLLLPTAKLTQGQNVFPQTAEVKPFGPV